MSENYSSPTHIATFVGTYEWLLRESEELLKIQMDLTNDPLEIQEVAMVKPLEETQCMVAYTNVRLKQTNEKGVAVQDVWLEFTIPFFAYEHRTKWANHVLERQKLLENIPIEEMEASLKNLEENGSKSEEGSGIL